MEAWRGELTLTAEYVATADVVVAERDGVMVGVGALEASGEDGELAHLWVAPEAQRGGVGAALVARIVALARDRGMRVLTVVADPHAVAFYRRLGAREVGTRAAPMEGAADRVVPVLELPTADGARSMAAGGRRA